MRIATFISYLLNSTHSDYFATFYRITDLQIKYLAPNYI